MKRGMPNDGYVCPDCQSPLERLTCPTCKFEFPCLEGIPRLFPQDPRFEPATQIAGVYDSIYEHHPNAWENQGRTPEFIRYFTSLLAQFPSGRFLEIGCGEGFLLAALQNGQKYATDLSLKALRRAQSQAQAHLSLALAERLPFPSDYFDLIASVGVTEHFLDIPQALREIRRTLKSGGYYVALTHVDLTLGERLAAKVAEFGFPRPRPMEFLRWLGSRWVPRNGKAGPKLVRQPIQNRYTTRGGQAWLEKSGFKVLDVIHTRKHPELPLVGPWVVIYVARR